MCHKLAAGNDFAPSKCDLYLFEFMYETKIAFCSAQQRRECKIRVV